MKVQGAGCALQPVFTLTFCLEMPYGFIQEI